MNGVAVKLLLVTELTGWMGCFVVSWTACASMLHEAAREIGTIQIISWLSRITVDDTCVPGRVRSCFNGFYGDLAGWYSHGVLSALLSNYPLADCRGGKVNGKLSNLRNSLI